MSEHLIVGNGVARAKKNLLRKTNKAYASVVCNLDEIALVVIDLIISGTVWNTNNRWLAYLADTKPSFPRVRRDKSMS